MCTNSQELGENQVRSHEMANHLAKNILLFQAWNRRFRSTLLRRRTHIRYLRETTRRHTYAIKVWNESSRVLPV